MTDQARADPLNAFPPRGLNRLASAAYVGVSPNTFDALVADGRMPAPKRVGTRKIWDRAALDIAFDGLPDDGEGERGPGGPAPANPWDHHTWRR